MSRMLWVGVGAVGGVIVYRRGQRAVSDAKERGLVGNVQHAALTASHVAGTASKVLAFVGQVGQGPSPERRAIERDAARWRELQESALLAGPALPQVESGAGSPGAEPGRTEPGRTEPGRVGRGGAEPVTILGRPRGTRRARAIASSETVDIRTKRPIAVTR